MSGGRQSCLLLVRLLTHLHASLACLELYTNSQHSLVLLWKYNLHLDPLLSALACLTGKMQRASKSPPSSSLETRKKHRGHVGTAHSVGLRFITVALLWRTGDWAGTANMTVLSPWPRVEVMSLSEMNHSSSPEGPPGLSLKSYIIVLLRGGPHLI